MANYADATRTPRTLTDCERRALLKVTGEHRAGFRDHLLYAMALATGLRKDDRPSVLASAAKGDTMRAVQR